MSKLTWESMPSGFEGMELWAARDGFVTYVISRDTGCRQDDEFYGRFSVSQRYPGTPTINLGTHDTLEAAKQAAEKARRKQ